MATLAPKNLIKTFHPQMKRFELIIKDDNMTASFNDALSNTYNIISDKNGITMYQTDHLAINKVVTVINTVAYKSTAQDIS